METSPNIPTPSQIRYEQSRLESARAYRLEEDCADKLHSFKSSKETVTYVWIPSYYTNIEISITVAALENVGWMVRVLTTNDQEFARKYLDMDLMDGSLKYLRIEANDSTTGKLDGSKS